MDDENCIPQQALRNVLTRDFALGFLALFTFLAAAHSLTPTLPIYLARLGADEREIGILIGVVGIASLVSRLLVGGALQKYSERSVMMVGALLSVLVFLSYIVFQPFWPFLVIRFVQGLAFACMDTAVLTVVVRVTPQRFRGQAIGYVLLASPLSMAIAASMSVYLSNRYGFATLFLSCAGLSLCSFLSSWMVKEREQNEPDKPISAPRGGLIDFNIVVPAVVTFLVYFVCGALFAFIPLYGLKCGITNPGLFFSAVAVMLFFGRTIGARVLVAWDKERVIPAFLLLLMGAMATLVLSATLPMFVVVGLLWGAGLSFVVPATMAYALEYARSSGGTALGTYQAFMDLGMAVGPGTMGMLLPHTGYRMMFLCLAVMCLANLGYFQFFVRKRAHRPSNDGR